MRARIWIDVEVEDEDTAVRLGGDLADTASEFDNVVLLGHGWDDAPLQGEDTTMSCPACGRTPRASSYTD